MSQLTEDEIVCLTIMGDGENMLAIGRWKPAIEHLTEMGLARNMTPLNYVITNDGRAKLAEYNKQTDDTFLRLASGVKSTKEQAARTLEMAARNLADAAKLRHEMTGEFANQVVWEIGQDIIKRALELLK